MKHIKLKEKLLYDGSQIEPQWAFRTFKIKDSNIVSWIGPMDIQPENIVDYEDQHNEIKGDELLHFMIEHFDSQPANIRLCYHRQRLFILLVKDNLDRLNIKTLRKGDDLYYINSEANKIQIKGKFSVSIATCSNTSMKIHFALNITSEGTPSDVEVASIMDCLKDLSMEDLLQLSDKICEDYINEISSIEQDITKTKVF